MIAGAIRCMNVYIDTHRMSALRTNIEIDDRLIADAMEATGLPIKKATVEAGLKASLERKAQMRAIDALRGIGWEGELGRMREGDQADWDR